MELNHKIIKSVKRAAVARYFGCSLELLHDASTPGHVVFRARPRELAEEAIMIFEAGELLPAKMLLDEYSKLYRDVRTFLREFNRVDSGKQLDTAGEK